MSSRTPGRLALPGTVAAALVVLCSGCARPAGTLELTSYKDPYFPETYQVEFGECAYYVGPSNDYHIVGRDTHDLEDGARRAVTQLMHVHLFWRPRPGKTFDNPSTVDATIRYAILTEQGAAVYRGTGFVYANKGSFSDTLRVEIENARLRLELQEGDAPDLLGAARVVGELSAEANATLALDLRRELDLRSAPTAP
jgi:hypothetical protein